MLSIKPIGGSDRQIGYYAHLGREDYYTRGGEPPGIWWGDGAERLGLAGQVRCDDFASVLRGFHPGSEEARSLVQNAGHKLRRSGFDLTWSAPKSVSVLWSQSDEDQRKAIEGCVQRAVERAMEATVSLCAKTRRGSRGLSTEKAKLVAALFRHETARGVDGALPDPHLHWHAVLCNVAVRSDGTFGALDGRGIFQPHMKMALGALFRTELAQQLGSIGLSVHRPVDDSGKQKSWFELDCIPVEVLETFSKRRQQVHRWLSERSLSGAKASERAALLTRSGKQHFTRDELFETWRANVQQLSRCRAVRFALPHHGTSHSDSRLDSPIDVALKEITASRARFSELELLRFTAQAAQTADLGIDQVFHLVNDAIKHSQELVHLPNERGVRQFTTREMLRLEKRLLSLAAKLNRTSGNEISGQDLDSVLTNYPTLRDEQARAVTHITRLNKRIACVNGLAGTGKTFMLQVAKEVWESSGKHVIGTTLAAKASQTLQSGSGIESLHLHPLLNQLETGQRELNPRDVVVLDEAGMVGTRQMARLLDFVGKSGAKIVLVGDHRQLQAIDAGAPFRGIAERFGAATLNNVTRQRDEWARDAVVDFSRGRAMEALHEFASRGLLAVEQDRESALRRLVQDWLPLFEENPEGTVVLAGTRLEVKTLNQLCQERRRGELKLTEESMAIGDTRFYGGDRVVFTRNKPSLLVRNGSTGTVVGVDDQSNTIRIRLDDGFQIDVDANSYSHIELGYAISTHKGQGLTVESALVLTGGSMTDRELTYVQASRARTATRIYTDIESGGNDLEVLVRQMQRSRTKELAHDFLLEAS